jgi:hypothetical protein
LEERAQKSPLEPVSSHRFGAGVSLFSPGGAA